MLNKIIFIIFQILGIYAITFMLLHFIPGDPIQVMLGDSASIADQDKKGVGIVLDQFGNLDNPKAHFEGTGPEIWRDTKKKVTHFVSSMGTTGTIVGTSSYLKKQNPAIQIIGVQPEEGAQIPGIRKWPPEYLPKIFSNENIDNIINVSQADAENTARELARVKKTAVPITRFFRFGPKDFKKLPISNVCNIFNSFSNSIH